MSPPLPCIGALLIKGRYHELLFMIDTCQANTMYSKLYSPNIIATGSSEIDQSSYSHHADNDVGVAVIDRYTYYNLDFLEKEVREPGCKKTLGDLFDSYDYTQIHSNPGIRWDLFPGGEQAGRERTLMDFFGNVQNVEVDGQKNETELLDDLKALEKKIAVLRSHEPTEANESVSEAVPEKTQTFRMVGASKVEADNRWFGKKAIGAWALSGLALAWAGASYLEAK